MDLIFETYPIPSWALCHLINGDATGLSEEDILLANNWMSINRISYVCPPAEDAGPYFTTEPAFGLACDVYDCECAICN